MAEEQTVENKTPVINGDKEHNSEESCQKIEFEVTDEELRSHTKLNRDVFDYLRILLDDGLSKRNKPEKTTSNNMQLYIALQFLTSGKNNDSADLCIKNVVNALIEVAPHFIKFPTDFTNVRQQFYSIGEENEGVGFPNVIGIIDCAHIPLCLPTATENPELYVNRYSQHSINVQFVCGPDLQIYNVFAAFPGSKEDSYIWINSNLHHVFAQSNLNDYWLIGDLEYPQEPWLMTPVKDPETQGENLYNNVHAVTRKPIEKCIALLKSRFECLQTALNYDPATVCAFTVACCILHNICIQHDDINIDVNLKEPSKLNESSKEMNATSMDEGITARNMLIKNNFTH